MLRDKLKFDVDRGTVLVVVILAMIMALAFFIRVYWAVGPSIEYGYSVSGGSDSYYHERVLKYILDSKHQLLQDPMLNYPLGASNPRPPLFHWAIILGSMLFYPFMNAYDSAVLMLILFPAIWGTLTIIPLYLLGRESFNRKIGLVAAFLLAVLPAHIMRSVATQADWDAFDLFLIISMFYFFLKSLKEVHYKKWVKDWFKFDYVKKGLSEFAHENKKAMIYAALAGASLGALALAWKGYTYALAILVIYLVIQIFINRLRNKSNLHIMLLASIFTIVGFGMAFPWYFGTNRLGQWFDVPLIIILAPIVLALFFEVTSKYPWPFVFLVGGLGIGVILLILNVFFTDLWLTIMSGQGYFVKSKLYSTIAEAQPASMAALSMSFGVGIFFLSIFGAFYLVYLIRKRRKEHYIFFAIYVIVAIYMAISAARFMFNASPAIALAAAIAIIWIIEKIDIKKSMEEFAKYKGALRKSIKRNVKFSQIVAVIVLAFLVITPAVWSAVDAGIPYETKKEFDKQIYNSMPSFMRPNETTYNKSSPWYLGAFGYSLPKEDYPWPRAWKWLSEQDNNTPPEYRPAFVSWWDYGFEAIQEGKHPAVADNFQNGYQIAAQIITAQNESEVISLFIARMLEGDYHKNNGNLSSSVLNALEKYAGDEKTAKILDILKDPDKYRSIIVENPQIYGLYSDDISSENALYVAIKGTLAYLPEEKLISIYDSIRNSTGWDIRYFAVDYRLFPFSGMHTGIFYAPAKLGDRRVEQYGGTVVPYDFYELKAVDENGHEYDLDDVPRNVRIINYKIEYKPMFYKCMLYRTFIGYSGKDIGKGDGIPGFSPSLGSYQPMQAWNMTHFKLVYKTAYWNPYKDYKNHSDAWKPIPIDLALKYYREDNGTVDVNPPAYQVLPNDVVMVKFYEGAIIEGYVKLSTGEPLKHVRVTILDEFGVPHDSTVTDDEGHYKLLSVAGNMTLVVSTNGELNKLRMIEKTILYQKSINVTEEQAMRVKPNYIIKEDVVLKPSALDGVVYFDLNRNGKIDDSDIKVSNATLILRNETYGFAATSSIENGEYEIAHIPPHSYDIALIINGKEFNKVESVTLNTGVNLTKDIPLLPCFINGTVSYSNGTPAINATVTLQGLQAKYTAHTDANGTYHIMVVPDNYTVEASIGNYYSQKTEISVPNWNYTTMKNITLKKGYLLKGYVKYDNIPIKGAVVKVKSELMYAVYIATTNAEGYFSLELPGGIYSIYILGTYNNEKIAYMGVKELNEDLSLSINLHRAYRLYGYITSKEKIENIEISIFKGDTFTRWFANSTGFFEMYLPGGTYNIGFLGFNFTNVPYFDREIVNLNKDTEISATLQLADAIKGYVYYDKNENGVWDENETLKKGIVMLKDEKGYYEVRNIPPLGEFTLASNINYEVEAIVYGYHMVDTYTEDSKVYVGVEPNTIVVRGTVYVDNLTNEVPLNLEFVSGENNRYTLRDVTSQYSINLPPGEYQIRVIGRNITYVYKPINLTLETGERYVNKDIRISAKAHVNIVSQASEVYWFQNGELVTRGKVVDITPGKYLLYLTNFTNAAFVKLNVWQNMTVQILLEPSYYVRITQENYSYNLPVTISTSWGNITWSGHIIYLPEGYYQFSINKERMVWGEYYRSWAQVTQYINSDTTILLHITTEKVVIDVEGTIRINGQPVSDAIVRFIPYNSEIANITTVSDTNGHYLAKLTPGKYMVYTYYIMGEKRYAYLSETEAKNENIALDIEYQPGYLLSGSIYKNGEKVKATVIIETSYEDLKVSANGSYYVILPPGDYTVKASITTKEYGMNVKYSFQQDVNLQKDTYVDVKLKREDIHKITVNLLGADNIAEPYKQIWVLVKIKNEGNTPEDVKFVALGGWEVVNAQTYSLEPSEEKIVSLSLKVPLVQAGENEVHLRAKYSGYQDIYFNTTVTNYYNTSANYTLVSWDGNTMIYRIDVSNNGNTWVNYTLQVLNSQELANRGWDVKIYVNDKEINYLNLSSNSQGSVEIRISATKDKPGTSVPLQIAVKGEKIVLLKIPLKTTLVEASQVYIAAPEITNYTEFTIPMEWYIIWALTAATFAAFLVVWRWKK